MYGQQKAVNNISFNIHKGEIVGFLGPNGAGKSTTMKIVTGYLLPDAGNAKVCGIDVSENPIEAKNKIGYLPEANPLYYDMYVKEYLLFVAGVYAVANKKAAVNRTVEMVGLTPEFKKKIGQLSKGYKQRVGLAASLIHDPEVLILDEPTSALDARAEYQVFQRFAELTQGKIAVLISHRFSTVRMADRILVLDQGNMLEIGTHEELLASGGRYAELFELQAMGYR